MVAKKDRIVIGGLMIEEIDWVLEYVGSYPWRRWNPYIGRHKHIKLFNWNMHKRFVYQINKGSKEG